MEEWKEYKARDFCSGVTDGTHDSPKPTNEGHYLITSKHLKDNLIDFSSANRISEEDYLRVITRSAVEQYDILFSMIGTIGNVVQVKLSEVDFAVKNMGIFKMGKNELKSSWLYYWLKSDYAKEYINQRLAGSTQSYLTLESLRDFPLYYPNDMLANQIISVLKSLDSKIEVNRQINDNLEQEAQALFKSWFVDFEPFKDGEFMESELGMIPKGWKTYNFCDILSATNEKVGDKVLKEYSVGNSGIRPRSEVYHKIICSTPEKNRVIRKGNLVFGMGSDRVTWGIMKEEIGATSPAYPVYSIDDRVDIIYFEFFFDIYYSNAKDLIRPSVRQGQTIDKGALMQKRIYVPGEDLWRDFLRVYKPLVEKKDQLYEEIQCLARLRDLMLPRLMSGEIKVSEMNA